MTAKGSSPTKSLAQSTAWPSPSGSFLAHVADRASDETPRETASSSCLPFRSSVASSSKLWSKWSSIAPLPRPVTMMMCSIPDAIASSTPYWMMGLSTSASISLGITLVAGKKRVPSPPAGKTAFRTRLLIHLPHFNRTQLDRTKKSHPRLSFPGAPSLPRSSFCGKGGRPSPYSAGESSPSIASRTILIGGNPCRKSHRETPPAKMPRPASSSYPRAAS
jgi:hypothetical protein